MTSVAVASPGSPRLELAGGCATIALADPDAHNRITPTHLAVLHEYLDRVEADKSLHLLVLCGSGDRSFCSGYDASLLYAGLDARWEALLERIEALPLPTLCAMNGNAYGGGLDLALCCDLRIGVSDLRIAMLTARLGVVLYAAGMRRIVRVLGAAVAKRLLLTAMPLQGEELLRSGFLTEAVQRGALDEAVKRYASAIEACSADSIVTTKQFLNKPVWSDEDVANLQGAHERSIASTANSGRLSRWNDKP